MRLVQLTRAGDTPLAVWVNPMMVKLVKPHAGHVKPGLTEIYFDKDQCYIVTQAPQLVVDLLTESYRT